MVAVFRAQASLGARSVSLTAVAIDDTELGGLPWSRGGARLFSKWQAESEHRASTVSKNEAAVRTALAFTKQTGRQTLLA
jgi:hypothetical protein